MRAKRARNAIQGESQKVAPLCKSERDVRPTEAKVVSCHTVIVCLLAQWLMRGSANGATRVRFSTNHRNFCNFLTSLFRTLIFILANCENNYFEYSPSSQSAVFSKRKEKVDAGANPFVRANTHYRSKPTQELYLFKKLFLLNVALKSNFSASKFCQKPRTEKVFILTSPFLNRFSETRENTKSLEKPQ